METNKEQLMEEMNSGILIVIEAVDKRISNKIVNVLETALKYEFKDRKFVVVNPSTSTQLASISQTFLMQDLSGASRLLVAATLISEATNVIRANLLAGNNVITTSYLTDMVVELSNFYNPMTLAGLIQLMDFSITKNAEIILFSPVPENNEQEVLRLQRYYAFSAACLEDNGKEDNSTISYRIDTSIEKVDSAIEEVINIIGGRLAQSDSVKEFALKLFTDEPQTESTEEDITKEAITETIPAILETIKEELEGENDSPVSNN